MKLEPQRVKVVLWRFWRGEEPAAIAAAVLTDVRMVDDVLRPMLSRLTVHYAGSQAEAPPPAAARAKPDRRGVGGRPRRQLDDELVASLYDRWKAGAISMKAAQAAAGCSRTTLMTRFADLGDPQARAQVDRKLASMRARTDRIRRGEDSPSRIGPAPKPIPQDLLQELHDEWQAGRITLTEAGRRFGLSPVPTRLRFADISDPALAERIRARSRVAARRADPGPPAPAQEPERTLDAFLAQNRTMEELYDARSVYPNLTWYRMGRHLNVSDTEVRRKAAQLGDPEMIAWWDKQRERARATQRAKRAAEKAEAARAVEEQVERPDARMVRMRGGELRAAARSGDAPAEPWSTDEPLDVARERTKGAMTAAELRRRRALQADPPDPNVRRLMERRAREPGGEDAREALTLIGAGNAA